MKMPGTKILANIIKTQIAVMFLTLSDTCIFIVVI